MKNYREFFINRIKYLIRENEELKIKYSREKLHYMNLKEIKNLVEELEK